MTYLGKDPALPHSGGSMLWSVGICVMLSASSVGQAEAQLAGSCPVRLFLH